MSFSGWKGRRKRSTYSNDQGVASNGDQNQTLIVADQGEVPVESSIDETLLDDTDEEVVESGVDAEVDALLDAIPDAVDCDVAVADLPASRCGR